MRYLSTDAATQISISYVHDESNGWMPHSWTIDALRGLLKESATVTTFAINKSIADSEFELDYSGGAIVQEAKQLSIVYPDGKRRQLQLAEINGHNFQDLLNSEPNST